MSPVRMQLPVTAAVHMTKKQAHLGLLPASELRKGRTMAQKQKLQNSGMQIPDDAILRIAQAMLPLMQQYFESEEGRLQLSRQTEALEQKEAAPASQPAPPLIFAHYLCVDIKIINPNPSPIRKKFGFINNGDPYGNRTHLVRLYSAMNRESPRRENEKPAGAKGGKFTGPGCSWRGQIPSGSLRREPWSAGSPPQWQ